VSTSEEKAPFLIWSGLAALPGTELASLAGPLRLPCEKGGLRPWTAQTEWNPGGEGKGGRRFIAGRASWLVGFKARVRSDPLSVCWEKKRGDDHDTRASAKHSPQTTRQAPARRVETEEKHISPLLRGWVLLGVESRCRFPQGGGGFP